MTFEVEFYTLEEINMDEEYLKEYLFYYEKLKGKKSKEETII
ncbi:hypothetical protein Q3223_04230 [Clostridioides sp. GD02367]